MNHRLVRALVIVVLLLGSTLAAAAVFRDQVSSVLFSDEFDDY